MDLAFITWDVDPEIFSIGSISIRYYGLLFACGFLAGGYFMNKMFVRDGRTEKDVENLTIYMIVGTVVGARLGHCLFYDFHYYFIEEPLQIFQVWNGGLASHGAAIGILISIYLFNRKHKMGYLWVADRLTIVIALAGFMIRTGNLMNSEIVGIPTEMPWGFIFIQNGEDFARHPAQLYEAISLLIMFIGLYYIYLKTDFKLYEGRLSGIFLSVLFALRFMYEFFKEVQEQFEESMILNMGQILSIPLVLAGIYLIVKSKKKTS